MLKYIILFVLAAVFSFALTPLVRFLASRFGAMDLPGERKIHSRPIPRLGGISIFFIFYSLLFVSIHLDFFYFPAGSLEKINFWWLLAGSGIVLCLGAVDDFKRMPSGVKFFFQIIAGLTVALTAYRIETISLPLGIFDLGIWSIPLTVFWVVGITNAVNLLDGLDGLAAGTCFIVSIALFGISLLNQDIPLALVSVILAGSILGFLRHNFYPASIFLGDSGAYFLGFILSVLSLQTSMKGTTTVAILVPIIALGLPIMDTALSMIRRLLKSLHIMKIDSEKNVIKFFYLDGWSIFRADRDHIHHHLIKIGLTQRRAVGFLYGISLVLGALALSTVYFKNINHAVLLSTIVIAFYIGIRRLGYDDIQILKNGALLPLFDIPVVSRRFLRVFIDIAIVAFSYYLAFLLRFEGDFSPKIKDYYLSTLPLVLGTKVAVFHIAGLYRGAWKYASVADLIRMARVVVFGCMGSAGLLMIMPTVGIHSRAVLLIDFNLLLLFVVGSRSSFRVLEYLHASTNSLMGKVVLILGAGKGGVAAAKEFQNNPGMGMKPFGFLDDDPRIQGKHVNGYPVLGTLDSLKGLLEKRFVNEVILSIRDISQEKLERISEVCASYEIPLLRFQIGLEDISAAGDRKDLQRSKNPADNDLDALPMDHLKKLGASRGRS